jgi:hypothetical protein
MKIEANGPGRGVDFFSGLILSEANLYEETRGDGLNLRPND